MSSTKNTAAAGSGCRSRESVRFETRSVSIRSARSPTTWDFIRPGRCRWPEVDDGEDPAPASDPAGHGTVICGDVSSALLPCEQDQHQQQHGAVGDLVAGIRQADDLQKLSRTTMVPTPEKVPLYRQRRQMLVPPITTAAMDLSWYGPPRS